MIVSDDVVSRIESSLLDAAVDASAWPKAIAELAQITGSTGVVVLPIQGQRTPGLPMSEGISEGAQELCDVYFRDGWVHRDRRANGMAKLLSAGVMVDQDFTTPDAMRRDPYYTDFLGRLGFQWFAGIRIDAGSDIWCLTLQRSSRQGLFTLDEQAGLARLITPISRVATFAQQLGQARTSGIVDALEALNIPSLLVNRFGDVIRVNESARKLVGGDLAILRGKITVAYSNTLTRALNDHVAATIWADFAPNSRHLNPVVIPREGRRPLLVRSYCLKGIGPEFFGAARAIVQITDLDAEYLASGELLKQMFSLTDRETLLAQRLVKGSRLPAIALELHVSHETIRSHLRAVFAKTGTKSQNELLLLLSHFAKQATR